MANDTVLSDGLDLVACLITYCKEHGKEACHLRHTGKGSPTAIAHPQTLHTHVDLPQLCVLEPSSEAVRLALPYSSLVFLVSVQVPVV